MNKKKPKLERFLSTGHKPGSFHDTLQAFLIKKRRKGLSEYSIIHLYNSLYDLGDNLGNPPIEDINPKQLKAYTTGLLRRYSPGTIRPVVGDIKQFFRWCKKKKLTKKNIAKRLSKPRPEQIYTKERSAPETAVHAVVSFLTDRLSGVIHRDIFGQLHNEPKAEWNRDQVTAIRDLFILCFLYETGCRAGELSQLGSLTMNKACFSQADVYTVVSIGKTGACRLHFTNKTAEIWRVWYAVRPSVECEDYAIFSLQPTRTATPITTSGLSQMLVRRCKEAGTAVFRCHSLRHAKVKRARRLVGLDTTSALLGHSSIEITRRYGIIDSTVIAEAAKVTGIQWDIWGQPGNE